MYLVKNLGGRMTTNAGITGGWVRSRPAYVPTVVAAVVEAVVVSPGR